MAEPNGFIESLEALSWLEQSDGKERVISDSSEKELSPGEALSLVLELYAAGATQVLVLNVEIDEDFEDASALKVMLPQDLAARAALFAIEARMVRELNSVFDPEGERGQQSFMLGW